LRRNDFEVEKERIGMRRMQMFLFAVWLGCVFALLPSGLAHAQFDLEQEPVTYESLDTYDDTSLFELKIDHRAKEDGKKRYIMVNKNNPDEWIAFTYDVPNETFTMYRPESGDRPYSYRRFLPDGTLLVKSIEGEGSSGVYKIQSDGKYYHDQTSIIRYITDGMMLFWWQVKK
jgi:lipoprotein